MMSRITDGDFVFPRLKVELIPYTKNNYTLWHLITFQQQKLRA